MSNSVNTNITINPLLADRFWEVEHCFTDYFVNYASSLDSVLPTKSYFSISAYPRFSAHLIEHIISLYF